MDSSLTSGVMPVNFKHAKKKKIQSDRAILMHLDLMAAFDTVDHRIILTLCSTRGYQRDCSEVV